MKQYTYKEFVDLLKQNNYHLSRVKGSHCIFVNKTGKHIAITKNKINACVARRLIKENHLL